LVEIDRRLATAAPVSFWLDRLDRPPLGDTLAGVHRADLTVVGGGYSGLWTALLAKQAEPAAEVILLEGDRVAWAATGRNGGFCEASLTYGEVNGRDRFASEFYHLEQLGRANLDAIGAFVADHHVDCGWEATGVLTVATSPWQIDGLEPARAGYLGAEAVRAEVDSPTYLGGRWDAEEGVLVDPAALAWGLRQACLDAGVEIFERSAVTGLQRADLSFTRRWGGAIDTCSRFCAFFGTAMGGRVAYAAGYTGLGVGATRFGARVMLDLLAGAPTELTELQMVKTKPVPFPPEPLGWAAVQATRWSIARADANGGRRNLWLRLLDRAGLGFDS
jgi:glycine/D-amino acid oxidase-like deaminating enzyme